MDSLVDTLSVLSINLLGFSILLAAQLVAVPYMAVAVLAAILMFAAFARFALQPSRELARAELMARSPVFQDRAEIAWRSHRDCDELMAMAWNARLLLSLTSL